MLPIESSVNQSSPGFFVNTCSGESFDSLYTQMRFPYLPTPPPCGYGIHTFC